LKTVILKGGIGVNWRFETLALIWIKVFDNFTISYLKISSSSWKTAEKSYKGALKLEVPKMPIVEEFNPSKVSR